MTVVGWLFSFLFAFILMVPSLHKLYVMHYVPKGDNDTDFTLSKSARAVIALYDASSSAMSYSQFVFVDVYAHGNLPLSYSFFSSFNAKDSDTKDLRKICHCIFWNRIMKRVRYIYYENEIVDEERGEVESYNKCVLYYNSLALFGKSGNDFEMMIPAYPNTNIFDKPIKYF